jgi:16S rRNA (guanine966-N2)-methyltransferase
MRIIAGLAKGRTLSTVAGATRPTSDRAREGLFSSLLSEFGDFTALNVLDLFAGSGAIGLEALSRGAGLVHAVEKNEAACRTITKNAQLVTSAKIPGEFHLYSLSAQRFLEIPAPAKYDIVYLDPPYDFSDVELYKCLVELRAGQFLKEDAVIAVERASKSGPMKWPNGYEAIRERNYGQAVIHYGKLAQNG